MESFVWQLDQICRVNFVVHAEVSGRLEAEQVRQALRAVQARHPLLRVRIEAHGRGAAYFRSGTPAIELRVLEVDHTRRLDELDYELNTEFPWETGPLVRCVLLRHAEEQSSVMLCFHHAIGDGLSGAYVMRDLIQAAAGACASGDVSMPALELPLNISEHFPRRAKGIRGFWAYLKLVGAIRRESYKNRRGQRLREDGRVSLTQRRTISLPFRFEADFTQALIDKSRREETSVHGALAAALALAVTEDCDSRENQRLTFGTAVSMRDKLEVLVGQDCGGFASGVGTFLDVDSEGSFWSLARDIKQKLSRSIARDEHFVILPKVWGAYSRIGRWFGWSARGRDRFASLLEKMPPPGATLTHSNIGRLEIAHRHGSLAIQSIGITRALSALSTLGSTATTLNGVLYWHIEGVGPLLSRDRIHKIAERAVAILKRAVGQECDL